MNDVAPSPAPLAPPPDSVDRIARSFARDGRRSWIIIVAVLAACAIGGGVFWFFTRSQLPDLTSRDLEQAEKATTLPADFPREYAFMARAETIADIEENRLPDDLLKAWTKLHGEPSAQYGRLVIARAIAEGGLLDRWERVCDGGKKALASALQEDPSTAAASLYEACNFQRIGFLSADEAKKSDAMVLALTTMTYEFLVSKHALVRQEESLLRAIALE